jgi:hypothetical protein
MNLVLIPFWELGLCPGREYILSRSLFPVSYRTFVKSSQDVAVMITNDHLPVRPKLTRASGPKVRTGCITW